MVKYILGIILKGNNFMTDLKNLTQKIPYKWRVQSFSKSSTSASCVAYIDARDVMTILDEVVGPENWQSDYKEIKGNLYAGIAIRIDDEWIWKWDCGTESNAEKEKGEASDAFKRAAVKWGVGRFLYDIPIQFVKTNEPKTDRNFPFAVDDKGNKIKDLSLHLNKNAKITNIKPKHKFVQEKIEQNINDVLDRIETCDTLDQLRKIREENISLESVNTEYKNALSKKYNLLTANENKNVASN